MAKINFIKERNSKNSFDVKPKLPYLGKRVKKINLFVNGIKYEFLVQANKNHSICNIVAINRVENTLVKISEALGKFYGRQYDSSNTIYQLENFLREILESK